MQWLSVSPPYIHNFTAKRPWSFGKRGKEKVTHTAYAPLFDKKTQIKKKGIEKQDGCNKPQYF